MGAVYGTKYYILIISGILFTVSAVTTVLIKFNNSTIGTADNLSTRKDIEINMCIEKGGIPIRSGLDATVMSDCIFPPNTNITNE